MIRYELILDVLAFITFYLRRNMRLSFFITLIVFFSFNCVSRSESVENKRPEHWAAPISMDGVPNLHKVSETLYRSAQPTAEGIKNLKAYGIKTIINLRSFHSDKDEIKDTSLDYEHIYMKAWHPEIKEAVRFLKIVTDPKRTPVLVHCQHGADRTGTMCAIYRVAIQGWTKEEAMREMREGGFGFHEVWKNLPKWFKKLDIEAIKKQAVIE
jgi:protein tyrosine/serine phosphatase